MSAIRNLKKNIGRPLVVPDVDSPEPETVAPVVAGHGRQKLVNSNDLGRQRGGKGDGLQVIPDVKEVKSWQFRQGTPGADGYDPEDGQPIFTSRASMARFAAEYGARNNCHVESRER